MRKSSKKTTHRISMVSGQPVVKVGTAPGGGAWVVHCAGKSTARIDREVKALAASLKALKAKLKPAKRR